MNNSNHSHSGGVGILGVIQIVFIILKLVGVINWSWWVVLIPLWIDLVFIFVVVIVVLLLCKAYDITMKDLRKYLDKK